MKSAITVKTCIADKWLHHCLIICIHMISMINGDITVCHNAFYITIKVTSACDKISLVITSDRTRRKPVLFWVNKHRIVLCCMEIKNRFKHIIFYLD